ncbi:DUF4390 domain-containing protein [bacterium]|nr:DUF4390 domain-containing protein [bacterium]
MVKRFLKITLFFFLPCYLAGQDHKIEFYDIWAENGQILAHIEVSQLINTETLEGLEKGMTAALEYKLQLWQDRSWSDKLISEKFHRMKLSFDPWSKRFTIETRNSQPHLISQEDLIRRCTIFETMRIAPLKVLAEGVRYYIVLKIILKPMSVENVNEITKWLSGEVKEINAKTVAQAPPTKKKAGAWLMDLVLNVTGFGDQVITAKSLRFIWQEGGLEVQKSAR